MPDSCADDTSGNDGWALVQLMGAPESFGYVPSDYISAVTQPATGSSASSAASPGVVGEAAESSRYGGIADTSLAVSTYGGTSSPARLSRFGGSTFGGSSVLGMSGVGALGSVPGASSAVTASVEAEFAQLFASHEEWFRAASAKRAEAYKGLLAEASDVLRSVREAESKSTSALDRLHALEKLLGDEKARWGATLAADAGLSA